MGGPMEIGVSRVPKEDASILRNLMELYQYDHSEWDGAETDERGLYGYTYFGNYWTEEGRHPFLIRADGKPAGFVLVRTPPNTDGENRIAEFFVMRKYRRTGIGRFAAHQVFDMFPGEWQVTQFESNLTARSFWERIIGEYTNGNYEQTEETYDGQRHPKQVFRSRARAEN